MKNSIRNFFAMNPVAVENGMTKPACVANRYLALSAKMNGNMNEDKSKSMIYVAKSHLRMKQ